MSKARVVVAGLAAFGVAGAALAASAEASPRTSESFVMNFKTFNGVDQLTHVSASGPIAGSGWSSQTETPTPVGETVQLTWHLPGGDVFIQVDETFSMTPDPTSCTAKAVGTGTWTITAGTDAYATASGSGTFEDHGSYVGTRDAHGVCDMQAEPKSAIFTVRGDGSAAIS